jgi:UDP-glucuronate 4-epimerase
MPGTTLVTGSAGFIGAALSQRLLEMGERVVGVDNHNDYYDPQLKEARLRQFADHPRYTHIRADVADSGAMAETFAVHAPDRVAHLAAQAGVRYSLEQPLQYVRSNIVGFANILEECRRHRVRHLVYASSSSVYGANAIPFSEHDSVDHPLSFYAATKKANEVMAHSYSHLFAIPATGLRFFTVYGPWGRPDMALFTFTKAILKGEPIELFNYGKHRRDFTYIDDIIDGIVRVLDRPAVANPEWDRESPDPATSTAPWRVYNLGSNRPVDIAEYVSAIERATGLTARIKPMPAQPGDVPDTWADVRDIVSDCGYNPATPLEVGVRRFVEWFRWYFNATSGAALKSKNARNQGACPS